jgi:hypothetical protein
MILPWCIRYLGWNWKERKKRKKKRHVEKREWETKIIGDFYLVWQQLNETNSRGGLYHVRK